MRNDFKCDWPIELSDNKLSNNKLFDNILASELVENRSFFFKPITIEEVVNVTINRVNKQNPRFSEIQH